MLLPWDYKPATLVKELRWKCRSLYLWLQNDYVCHLYKRNAPMQEGGTRFSEFYLCQIKKKKEQ